jgi:hypothetical protein
VADPAASAGSTGYPLSERVDAVAESGGQPMALSPVHSDNGASGIDGVTCASNTVVWWEVEGPRSSTGVDTLTVWRPGWAAPMQIATYGTGEQFSAGNGWITWFE